MRERLQQLGQKSFVRSVAVLVGGTAFGQAVALLALPLLTRLYSPQDFSLLAVYVGLLGIISAAACLRFDIAIPLPEKDEDAANVLVLALMLASTVSALLAIPIVLIPERVAAWIGQPKIAGYLWLLPIGVLLAGSYNAMQFWATRKKDFPAIARTRVFQSVGGAATQVGMGMMGYTPLGLMVGQMLNSGAGGFGLALRISKTARAAMASVSFHRMKRLFREYDRFPKYSSLEAFANNAAIQLPVILIASLAVGPEAGFLALAMRVMQAPMGLVGGAIGQVYLSRAAEEHRVGALGIFTAGILGGLLRTGVGPLLCVGIVAPEAFALVFGDDWTRAGVLVAWMTPWFVFQFLASPVSMALHITRHQRLALLLQIFGLALRVAFVVAAVEVSEGLVSESYAISGAVFYLVYLLLVLKVVSCAPQDMLGQLRRSAIYILPWCIGGFLFKSILWVIKHGFH